MGRVKHGRLTRAVRTSGRALVPVHLRAWSRRLGGLSRTGLAVAGLWFAAANTPSLLPRPWWLQGLIAAICAILGYATGHAIGAAGRAVAAWAELRVSMNPRRARLLTELTLAAMLLFALAFLIVQDRIDRRDPKLAVSSVRQRDNEVFFPDRFGGAL